MDAHFLTSTDNKTRKACISKVFLAMEGHEGSVMGLVKEGLKKRVAPVPNTHRPSSYGP